MGHPTPRGKGLMGQGATYRTPRPPNPFAAGSSSFAQRDGESLSGQAIGAKKSTESGSLDEILVSLYSNDMNV